MSAADPQSPRAREKNARPADPRAGEIYSALAQAAANMPPVPPVRTLPDSDFEFRNIWDLFPVVRAALGDVGVFGVPRRGDCQIWYDTDRDAERPYGCLIYVGFEFYAGDGSHVATDIFPGAATDKSALGYAIRKATAFAAELCLELTFQISHGKLPTQRTTLMTRPISADARAIAAELTRADPVEIERLHERAKGLCDFEWGWLAPKFERARKGAK